MNSINTAEQRLDIIRLSLVPGIGPRIFARLLTEFQNAADVLAAPLDHLQSIPGVGRKLSHRIALISESEAAEHEVCLCQEHGVEILVLGDEQYPRALLDIPDPPLVLYARGTVHPLDRLGIAIVGSRLATNYGRKQARRLATELAAAGFTIVSGLARGIDATAHRAALDCGGMTVAVLGSGVLNIYPPEHHELAEQVVESGCLLSESPPLRQPFSGAFPQRNRIVTGLCLGVVVVEASQKSGALISARHSMEQGREVFAVPGRIDSSQSRGCHQLLKDGAKLVECIDDIIEELGPLTDVSSRGDDKPVLHPVELVLNEFEQTILHSVGKEATSIDDIIANVDVPIHQVLSTISVLEMKRLVLRLSGNYVRRA